MAKKSRRPRRKASASPKKIVIAVGRKANGRRKASLLARGRKRLSKLGSSVRSLVFGAKKRKPSRRKAAGRKANASRSRVANGRKRNPLRRRRNPGFDIKGALISGAVLVAGTYLAQIAVPWIETKLIELAPNSIGQKNDKGHLATLGYIELAGAAGTIVLGQYLQRKFGSKKVDFTPAAYAIATYMALRGLRNTAMLPEDSMGVLAGTTQFGPALSYGSGYVDSGSSLAMNGTTHYRSHNPALPAGYSMLGSIFTDAQLPSPAVAPHNVMQGYAPSLV